MHEITMADPSLDFLAMWRSAGKHIQSLFEDVDGEAEVPGSREDLASVAEGWNGYPCLMPMRRTLRGWEPDRPGWGLIDFAVQVVRNDLQERGYEIMSSNSNPHVDPNIWFVADIAQGPEWVAVRATRFPELRTNQPAHLDAIARKVADMSGRGHFASVSFASTDDPNSPLLRGYCAETDFEGLEPLDRACEVQPVST